MTVAAASGTATKDASAANVTSVSLILSKGSDRLSLRRCFKERTSA